MLMKELIPRVLRDIGDGVLVLDLHGHIIYTNPQLERMLGLGREILGLSYAQLLLFDDRQENDAFHQFILDAVYQKQKSHVGTVPFYDPSGNKRFLKVTASFLMSESGKDPVGVVLVVSDVTQTELLKQKRHDACIVFACVVACISLYLMLLGCIHFFALDVSVDVLTQVINGMSFVVAVVIYFKTEFTREELGLKLINPGFTLLSSLAISAALVGLLIAVKLVLLRTTPGAFPEDAPFWRWDLSLLDWVSYPFTCAVQEFLARSMIYGSIRKMFDGKGGMMAAIILSSLLFGAVHIEHGFILMIGSVILLGSLGGLYEKHGNIWGVTIIHYVLGQAVRCLSFA